MLALQLVNIAEVIRGQGREMRLRQFTLCIAQPRFGAAIGLTGSGCGLVKLSFQLHALLDQSLQLLVQRLPQGLGLIQLGLDHSKVRIGTGQGVQLSTQRLQLTLGARPINLLELQFFDALQQRSLTLQLTDIALGSIQGQLGGHELFIDLANLLSQEGQTIAVVEAGQPVFIQALLILLVEEAFFARHQPLSCHGVRGMTQLLRAFDAVAVIIRQ
ncbi:hypothetical protein D9M69_491180 [compost metagenome]